MIYLVEIDAYTGSGVTRLYLSSDGFTTRPTDTPANTYYAPRIIDPGNFERSLYGQGTTRGQSQVGAGEIVFASGDPGNGTNLDAWLGYGFDGRAITIKRIAPGAPISSAVTLFRGSADQLVSDNPVSEFRLRLRDRLADLAKPLLTTRYAGTTITTGPTAEGNVDLKDQIKPRVWGRVSNVPATLVNAFDLIYQVSNSAVASIAAFDAGVPLTNGGDYADVAALRSATILPGQYATCLALGLFRVGAQPFKGVTADVVEGATAADRTAAQVARRMLLSFGIASADMPTASFAALDALNAAEVGIYLNSEETAIDAVSRVLNSIGAWISPDRLGVFSVGRLGLASGTPVDEFGEREFIGDLRRLTVDDEGKGIPAWRTTIRWGQVYQVQGDNDLVGQATTARRTLVASQWRETKVEDAAVKVRHLQAPEITIDTCLAYEADALAEAARVQALYGTRRDRYQFTAHISVASACDVGSVISLRTPRLGLSAGKLFTVIGRTDEYAVDTVTLDCWG
jgi:hypothetical protein